MASSQSFRDLRVWQEGHQIVLIIYQVTGEFPQEERFGLVSQMRRCAVSMTSNLAEGFGRVTRKEKARFYSMAQASSFELLNQSIISRDLHFLAGDRFAEIEERLNRFQKMTHNLMRSIGHRNGSPNY